MSRQEQILGLLQPGDVVNCDTTPRWWEVWLRVVYAQIRHYQKRKWGNTSRWRDVHSMLYLGGEVILSVTVPTAVICNLEHEIREDTKYRICRYLRGDWKFSEEELGVIRETARTLEGTDYDYGQCEP